MKHENENENTNITVFKVSNQMVTRRFTMPTKRPTWAELESKVREIFSIPSSVTPGLTYLDNDDDVITLSSQAELEDYYKQIKQVEDSSNTIYKFNLVIFTPIRDHSNDDNGSDYEEKGVNNSCPTQ